MLPARFNDRMAQSISDLNASARQAKAHPLEMVRPLDVGGDPYPADHMAWGLDAEDLSQPNHLRSDSRIADLRRGAAFRPFRTRVQARYRQASLRRHSC